MDGMGDITEGMRTAAKNRPHSWFPVVDPFFDPAGEVPAYGIVGWYWVDAHGQLAGEFNENPRYLPSPLAMNFPEPHNRLEFLLHCAATGYTSAESFAHALANSQVLAHTTAEGADVSIFEDVPGQPHVVIFTSEAKVPEASASTPVDGRALATMSEQVAFRVDPGTPMSVTLPVGKVAAQRSGVPEQREVSGQQEPYEQQEPSGQRRTSGQRGESEAAVEWPAEPDRDSSARTPDPEASEDREPPGAHDRFMASMLAGAAGDALGYAVEFQSIDQIRRYLGGSGLVEPVHRDGVAQVSDDTQMMLFTLEGLIRAHVARRMQPRDSDPAPEVQHAYQRWLHTQNRSWPETAGPYGHHLPRPDGWLITNSALFATRAPGNTCVSALMSFARTHSQATFERRINDSKGCGGVMRAAPVAVWSNDPAEVFYAAAAIAALTHSHPSGYLSAGVLATIVHQLIRAVPIADCVRLACELLRRWSGYEEQLRAIEAAEALAERGRASPEELAEHLGGGWVGEEALAIGLYAVLATDSLEDAVLLSVNHSGDSDSTGIVCGNIAGAVYGTRAIPPDWLGGLELRDVTRELAEDALVEFSPGPPSGAAWIQRYPAW